MWQPVRYTAATAARSGKMQSVSTADSVDDPAIPDVPVGNEPSDDDQVRRSTRESGAPGRYGDPVQY